MKTLFANSSRRIILLCAFLLPSLLLSACGDRANPNGDEQKDQSAQKQTQAASFEQASPLLSLTELLLAQDVKQGLAKAARNADQAALEFWQEQLLLAADDVYLHPKERALISGKHGLVFLRFQGIKTNYQTDFEREFFEFGDIEAIYARYPAFENMHKQSQQLVAKRDELIADMARQLEEDGFDGDALAQAKLQWQAFVSSAKDE